MLLFGDKSIRGAIMARRAFLVSISLVAATLPLEANAQTQSAQATVALEEIVVTSRKREESLLEIPIAVTAFSSADLEAKGITQFRQSDALRFELYGRNVFHDKTFPVYQLLTDFAYFGQLVRLLTAPLPDKPVFGARVAYDF